MFDYYYLLRDSTAFFPTLTDYGKLILKKQPMPPALLPLLVFLLGWMWTLWLQQEARPNFWYCLLPPCQFTLLQMMRKTLAFQSSCTTLTLQAQGTNKPPQRNASFFAPAVMHPATLLLSPLPRAGCTWRMYGMLVPAAAWAMRVRP